MTDQDGENETIRRFGHPESLIAGYRHWMVLLRTHQTTLGALILAARGEPSLSRPFRWGPMPSWRR